MIRTLGTGTFGRVKLVRHRYTAETYAMKILQKAQIVAFQQQTNVVTEKKIMAASKHPFILELVASFKDRDCLYMLLEVVQGGELFTFLQNCQNCKVESTTARFFGGCVTAGLEYLHRKKVLYRDLKVRRLSTSAIAGRGVSCESIDVIVVLTLQQSCPMPAGESADRCERLHQDCRLWLCEGGS